MPQWKNDITHSVCVCVFLGVYVALVIQVASHKRRITLSSVACTVLPLFFHIITHTAPFSKKKIYIFNIQDMFWFSLQLLSAKIIILRIRRDTINVHRPFRWGRDFPPVQTGPGAHPVSCKMCTGSFPVGKCGRGVLPTTHPLLMPRSWRSRAIPLPTLWAT